MSSQLLFSQDSLERYARNQVPLSFGFTITAGVPSLIGAEKPKLLVEKGLAGSQVILTQTKIDALLGVSGDVDAATAFGATAMVANDTMAFVVDCGGQLAGADFGIAYQNRTSDGAVDIPLSSLPNSAFTDLEFLITPAGNLVCRYQDTAVSAAATNSVIFFSFFLRLK